MAPTAKKRPLVPSLETQVEVDQHLGAICRQLRLSGHAADGAALGRINRRFGDQLTRIGLAGAAMVDRCAGPFSSLGTSPAALRDDLTHLGDLEAAELAVLATAQRLRQEINFVRTKIGGTVSEIHDLCRFTLLHPGWRKEERAELETAAQPFLGAIQQRSDAIAATGSATRSKNAAMAGKLAAAQAQNSRLEIENKYLAGEHLRPTDMGAPAAPAAPKASRRRTSRRTPSRK